MSLKDEPWHCTRKQGARCHLERLCSLYDAPCKGRRCRVCTGNKIFFFFTSCDFLHINRYLTSAQGKGNLVRSPGGLPEKKGFPLHGAKQVCSCVTAEDAFFNHTSNFSMSFSLGSTCKQHSLETTFCVPPWAATEKGSGLIISSFRIISLNLPSSKVLTVSVSSHIPLWRELPWQSTGVPRLPPPPLCLPQQLYG